VGHQGLPEYSSGVKVPSDELTLNVAARVFVFRIDGTLSRLSEVQAWANCAATPATFPSRTTSFSSWSAVVKAARLRNCGLTRSWRTVAVKDAVRDPQSFCWLRRSTATSP
jgi:hypothetical protein